jgi:hypothetical protein
MKNLSPPPVREYLPVTIENGENVAAFPMSWIRFFTNLVTNDAEVEAKECTTATRPLASSSAGKIIYVRDGAAGSQFQGSNGTSWVSLG